MGTEAEINLAGPWVDRFRSSADYWAFRGGGLVGPGDGMLEIKLSASMDVLLGGTLLTKEQERHIYYLGTSVL